MNFMEISLSCLLLMNTSILATVEYDLWQALINFYSKKEHSETKEKIYQVNYTAIDNMLDAIIDASFGITLQGEEIKKEINENRKSIKTTIIKQLELIRPKDYRDGMTKANELAYPALACYVGERAAQYADKFLQEKPPKFVNPTVIRDNIKNEFIQLANKALETEKGKHCSLCTLYGEALKIEVEKELKKVLK